MICAYSKAVGGVSEEGLRAEAEGPVWLSSQEVADRWHVHINSVRSWADSGKLPVHRLPGRFTHRRFLLSECERALGCPKKVDEEKVDGGARPVAIYARVSSSAQSKAFHKGEDGSDLARQVGRLKAYVKEHYGVEPVVLSDTGSGMSFSRDGLKKLMAMLLNGSLDNGVLVCTHVDRLARWGHELILQVAKSRKCEVVFCEREEVLDADEMACIANEIVAVLTHMAAKIHGKRAAKTNAAPMDAETVKEALKMRAEGMTQSQIAKELTKQGRKNSKGRGISFHAVNSLFSKAGDTLNPLIGDMPKNSIEEWGEANLVEDAKARKNKVKTFHRLYVEWATAQGKTPASWEAMRRYLSGRFDSCIYRCKKVYHCRLKGS